MFTKKGKRANQRDIRICLNGLSGVIAPFYSILFLRARARKYSMSSRSYAAQLELRFVPYYQRRATVRMRGFLWAAEK